MESTSAEVLYRRNIEKISETQTIFTIVCQAFTIVNYAKAISLSTAVVGIFSERYFNFVPDMRSRYRDI